MNTKFYIRIHTLILVMLATSISAQAETFIVINNNNSGAGSLRQAILDANAAPARGDTIEFTSNVRGRILLTGNEIGIFKFSNANLTINGPGADLLSIETNFAFRGLRVDSGTIKISGLRFSRGLANGFFSTGGGIFVVEGANLTLESCSVTENVGGGIASMSDSTLNINNSTIAGNDLGIDGAGTLSMSNSTVSDNVGADYGGIRWLNGSVSLINVTVSGNRGFETGGVDVNGATTSILNSTITDNGRASSPGNVGGLRTNGSTVNLKNTIVARNLSGTIARDVSGAVVSGGNNLIGDTTGGSGFIASDLQNVNPHLGGFANNGGATYTHSLLAISPAINAGNNTGAPATDQRGVARPFGAAVDVGAYESGVRFAAFGKIAFVSDRDGNREIYSMNADGTNQTRLTTNSATDQFPDWSPDGTKIAFATDRNGNFEIYTMNADGSNLTRLTTNSVPDSEPAWSPDGSKILFVRSDPAADTEVFMMDPSGANQTQLTTNSTDDCSPSWSPDGTQIVFTCIDIGSAICKMNADGTNRTPFFFLDAIHNSPAWSPEGNSIAASIDFGAGGQEIYFYNPFNINVFRPLNASTNPVAFAPALSPDSSKLAYHNFSSNGGDLFTIDADGLNPIRLIDRAVSGNSSQPDWFGFNTPVGSGISVVLGTTSVSYSSVTISGKTTVVPDPYPILPVAYACTGGRPCKFPSYNIGTTASYTAPLTVCVKVPSVTDAAEFSRLRILHYVNGTPTDATILPPDTPAPNFATKTICARVNSLSPFVVAEFMAPTAANVSVGGRVLTSQGYGIRNARVTLTNSNGATRTAITSGFGYYRFDEVAVGQTYVVAVRSKRYRFASDTQVLSVNDEITDLIFTALPE